MCVSVCVCVYVYKYWDYLRQSFKNRATLSGLRLYLLSKFNIKRKVACDIISLVSNLVHKRT